MLYLYNIMKNFNRTTYSTMSKSLNSIFNKLNKNQERMLKRLNNCNKDLRSSDEIAHDLTMKEELYQRKMKKKINFQQFKSM